MDSLPIRPSDASNRQYVSTDEINDLHTPVYKNLELFAAEGKDPNHRIVEVFGSSIAITNAGFTVISHGSTYETPIAAQALEFVSDNIGDALNGVGAHEITIKGLNENWERQTVVISTHATDGTQAVPIPSTWLRVFEASVTKSGAYATLATRSHLGTINIRYAGGGSIWASILFSDIAHGKTQIGAYTIPKGETGYLDSINVHTETNKDKAVNVFAFKREGANIITPPYSAMKAFTEIIGVDGSVRVEKKTWQSGFPAYTDLGFLALKTTAGTANCSIDTQLLLVKDDLT